MAEDRWTGQTLCAWCGLELQPETRATLPAHRGLTSHGICPPCLVVWERNAAKITRRADRKQV